jgi:hypothetical protein
MHTELKEVLIPFNAKEVEYFNEATAYCTDEQKLAVAKLMSEAELPDGYQFTESQIKRFVAQESRSKVNWFPNIAIKSKGSSATDAEGRIKELKERQFKLYRESGLSEAEARVAAGL